MPSSTTTRWSRFASWLAAEGARSGMLFHGNLGGLAGADAICNTLASNAGLAGSNMAWLSDSTDSPATRFAQPPFAYMLVDTTIIAESWSDLTDGSLLESIDLDENGVPQTYENRVWSGTGADGTALSSHCTG